MVLNLERAGLIRRQPGVPRSIEVLVPPKELPVLQHHIQPVKTSVCRGTRWLEGDQPSEARLRGKHSTRRSLSAAVDLGQAHEPQGSDADRFASPRLCAIAGEPWPQKFKTE